MVGLTGTEKNSLTVASVAHIKGISLATVYRWVRRNPGPMHWRNGRRILIDPAALDLIQVRNAGRSNMCSDADHARLKGSLPGNVDSSPGENAAGGYCDSAPQPTGNRSCGQRDLGYPSRSHFGAGLALISVPQFIG